MATTTYHLEALATLAEDYAPYDQDPDLICDLVAEVLNGGFYQWLTNSSTDDPSELCEQTFCAMTGWDCPAEASKCLLDVWRLCEDAGSIDSIDENELDAIDARFYQVSDQMLRAAVQHWS